LHLSRTLWHDDDAGLAQLLAGASQGLTKIPRGSSKDAGVRHARSDMIRGAKFEAARPLKRFARDQQFHTQAVGKARCFDEGCRPDDLPKGESADVRRNHAVRLMAVLLELNPVC